MSELWTKLAGFNLDSGDELLTFERRLARENGWTPGYSRRVLEEYKRFVFLCCEAGHPCTPSDQVDQAWHLHLTYTRSYWEELCQKVLQRPLHHHPTQGGAKEGAKFNDWYARTLESYERLFGQKAPADIWPPAAERFGVDPFAQRVNLKRHWVISKEKVTSVALLVPALLSVLTLAGCSNSGMTWVFVAGLLILFITLVPRSGNKKNDGKSGDSGGGCGGACGGGGCGGGGCGGCGG
ncbi:hypothetical protein ATI61_109278 [Archangium gephyra]|uniref:TIGR04222 domain-containing membrane protein n=1 Tax=Archangium gephyra TaxID=48 RepID=A0AAC8Q239_9BACT|nr:hypothetical protein [Archangium gephyra]AKI99522.1 Hypothetical protein AA314_01149 [Archangium gephyra]REG27936.1 hypothetical protein ATI61_109278 [Archangium gephyra]